MHVLATLQARVALLTITASLAASCASDRPAGAVDAGLVDVSADATADDAVGVDALDARDAASDDADAADERDLRDGDTPDAACDGLGCACDAASDCASGYCVAFGPGGARICSELCADSCSLEGYECAVLENSGGDAVRLCVPAADPTCEPCDSVADCGSLAAACLPLVDGDFCLGACDDETPCPVGFSCRQPPAADLPVCVPDLGVCSPCVDADGDRYGVGLSCLGPDPVDDDPTVYPGAPELCDGLDNDLNGVTDDVPARDRNACGGCEVLAGDPGAACGPCGRDTFVCDGSDAVRCDGDTYGNACGGCATTVALPGDSCGVCGSGTWGCDGAGGVVCQGDRGDDARNACGGCDPLATTPGGPCGTCGTGTAFCAGPEVMGCLGDAGPAVLNGCGGCAALTEAPGDACGTCGAGVVSCTGTDATTCLRDPGSAALNACGGCGTLSGAPGDTCGACGVGVLECDGEDTVLCAGEPTDAPASCLALHTARFGAVVGTVAGGTHTLRIVSAPNNTLTGSSDTTRATPTPP